MKRALLYYLLTSCVIGAASEVLLVHNEKPYVFISQETEKLLPQDRICVVRKKVDIGCGAIIVSETKYAIARIDYRHEEIKKYSESTKSERWVELEFLRPTPVKGDAVRIEQRNPKRLIREITSELVSNNAFGGETISQAKQAEIDLALKKIEDSRPFKPVSTLGAGMNYLFPLIHYQQAITPTWGLGMVAMYMNHSVGERGTLTGPGFLFTYNRYYDGPLNGFWWQLSPGAFRFTVKEGARTANGSYQPVVVGTVGWRYFWKNKVNFGFGAGAMYFPFINNAGNTGLAFNGMVPSITLEAGISF